MPLKHPILMKGASGAELSCTGTGDLILSEKLTVKNSLHCPNVILNLISAAQLADAGFTMRIDKKSFDLYNGKDAHLVKISTGQMYPQTPSYVHQQIL